MKATPNNRPKSEYKNNPVIKDMETKEVAMAYENALEDVYAALTALLQGKDMEV